MAIFRMLGNTGPQASATGMASAVAARISSADAKQFGLENFGNTCYINAILQALYFCPPFRDLVISTPDASSQSAPPLDITKPISPTLPKRRNSTVHSPTNPTRNGELSLPASPPTLFSALRSLFIYIAQNPNDKGKVSPTAFVQKVKAENEAFRNTNHQDAHEALNFILNKVMEDLEAEEKNMTPASFNGRSRKTLIHDLFEGTLTSETKCLTCETVSSRDESFLDLSIDIEPHSSVTACLRQFSASEMLCQRNKFSCDSCSGLQEAEKRMKVKKLPNVLALHLKRFKYQEEAQKFIKLSYRVAFPFELRLFNTVDDADNADRLYELFAIVVHIGVGPHHGHYTTIIRSQASWYLYDDDNVECIKETDIPKYFGESSVGSGYVLFYQAADMNHAEMGLPQAKPATPPVSKVASLDDVTPVALPSTLERSISGSPTTSSTQPAEPNLMDALFPSTLQSSDSPRPQVAENHAGEKDSLATRLRHYKSEKSIPNKLNSTPVPEQPVPSLPALRIKRPKTVDGASFEKRKGWLGGRRRPDPPSSYPHSTTDHLDLSSERPIHTRALSVVSDSTAAARNSLIPDKGLNQTTEPNPGQVRPRPTPSSTPATNGFAPSHPYSAVSLNGTAHSEPPLSLPPQRMRLDFPSEQDPSPPTGPRLSTRTVLSSGPIKKAVRKMSLSSMPMKFIGVNKKDR